MKFASLAVFVGVTLCACGLFEKNDAPAPARAPKVVAAVPHATLAKALPKTVADWTGEAAQSSVTNTGAQELARASVTFKKEMDGKQGSLSIEIIDGTHVPSVKSRLALMTHPSADVHLMDFTVEGHHGLQQWQPLSGGAFGFVVIGDRFLVTLNGSNVSPAVFRQAADAVDVRLLQSLAGVASPSGVASHASTPATPPVTSADTSTGGARTATDTALSPSTITTQPATGSR